MTRISLPHPKRLHDLFLSSAARPLRFAGTGLAAGALQLALLAGMTRDGWSAAPANLVAFLLAAQLNFALSSVLTWRDRATAGSLLRHWLLFHGSIAGMALLNMLIFTMARSVVSTLPAAALGIATAALGNYIAGDRLVFRHSFSSDRSTDPSRSPRRVLALTRWAASGPWRSGSSTRTDERDAA